ncbi:hypothetical protein [Aurantivibrio infirmus]
MDKPTRYFKLGVKGIAVTLILGIILSVGFEFGMIEEEGFLLYVIAIPANVGLFLFFGIGFYLWLHYFEEVRKTYNSVVTLIYFGSTCFGGYWAHFKLKNNSYVPKNI